MIADLYQAFTPRRTYGDVQAMQRWLGPYVTALNRNLVDHGLKVEPGALKNTYRLVASS